MFLADQLNAHRLPGVRALCAGLSVRESHLRRRALHRAKDPRSIYGDDAEGEDASVEPLHWCALRNGMSGMFLVFGGSPFSRLAAFALRLRFITAMSMG